MASEMTRSFVVDWGGQQRTLSVPGANVVAELLLTDLPPLPDPFEAIVRSFEDPIGCEPLPSRLRAGQKVAILTGDRVTDVMLGSRDKVGVRLLDYLNRLGIADRDITLVYAGGSHANPDWQARLGGGLLRRVRAVKHDARNDQELEFLGVTDRCTPVWINKVVAQADFWLAFGEVSPTVHGGWCGGGKIILPGVAGMDSIQQNHSYIVRDLNPLGLADGNHMRLDMEEAAGMAGPGMKVDVLVDSQARVVKVFAGDFLREHRAALPLAREIWMTEMELVDIIVIYPGEGHERHLSSSLFIRMEGADLALKDGGIAILALSAAGGWASPARLEQDMTTQPAVLKLSTEEIARLVVRREGNVRNNSMMYSAKRVLERRRVFLACDGISPQEANEFGFARCFSQFDDALAEAMAERGPEASIAVNIQSSFGRRTMPWREG